MYNLQLDILITVADCGSFTKAAQLLYISPTAVMKQINALEQRLDMQIFIRSPRGIKLTKAGVSLYNDAKKIIAQSAEALTRAKQIANNQPHTIRIGTSLMNPCHPLMDLWRKTSQKYANFKLRLVPFDDSSHSILHTLDALGRDFDLFIGACDSKEWFKRSNFYPLGTYKICCAIPRTHRLASKKLLSVEDLHGERLMMSKRGDSKILDNLRSYLEQKHPKIKLIDTPFFYDANILNQCEQEENLLLTLDCWQDIHAFLNTVPIAWNFTMPYGILYAKNPSPDVIQFMQILKNLLAKK